MNNLREPITGGCLCGAVRYQADQPPFDSGYCHCSMCRRPHGAPFVTWTAVPPQQLTITAGEEQVTRFECGPPQGVRTFCSTCGSQLFCQIAEDVVDVAMAALHEPIDRVPEEHYYYDSRADWVEINDDLPKLGGVDGMQPLE